MPELVIVTVCPSEACPRSTFPNWRWVGLTVIPGTSTGAGADEQKTMGPLPELVEPEKDC
ncbi:hypothetical protein WME79_47910 [Sorangium sp. So ce726]